MDNETKNLWDIILSSVAVTAAAVAFGFGLYQWRRSQAWQRAEKLDKFVEKFETDQLLKLAAVVVDWFERETHFLDREVIIWNDEALLALRDHRKIEERPMFPGEQPLLRDAYDALLAFFNRLELAISTKLIDPNPTKAYFCYWLEHFLRFDRHQDKMQVLNGVSPELMVACYIEAYGDTESVKRLCRYFDIDPPNTTMIRSDSARPTDEVTTIVAASPHEGNNK